MTEQRTAVDFTQFLKEVADDGRPDAGKIVQVLDNLSTHSPATFHEGYPRAESQGLRERFKIHHTPKQVRWLNIAEIVLSDLERQYPDRRLDNLNSLARELHA